MKAGATSEQEWTFWDILPTVADIAGVKSPEDIDGISMIPALRQNQSRQDFLYWEFMNAASIRPCKWAIGKPSATAKTRWNFTI